MVKYPKKMRSSPPVVQPRSTSQLDAMSPTGLLEWGKNAQKEGHHAQNKAEAALHRRSIARYFEPEQAAPQNQDTAQAGSSAQHAEQGPPSANTRNRKRVPHVVSSPVLAAHGFTRVHLD